VFDGIDDIDWASIHYVYGEATDVPELLRAAANGDDEALDRLLKHIWSGYDVYERGYEALARTMPFLVELLDVPVVDRVGLLEQLVEIVELYASWDEDRPPGVWLRAAWEAVIAGAPTYVRLLIDDGTAGENVRAFAARLLGKTATDGSPVVPAMAHASRQDPSPLVRASSMLALEDIGTPTAALLDGWLADQNPLPRLVATLTRSAPAAITREALRRDLPPSIDGLSTLSAWAGETSTSLVSGCLGDRWDLRVELLESLLTHEDVGIRRSAVAEAKLPLAAWRPAAARLAPLMNRYLYVGVALDTDDGQQAFKLEDYSVMEDVARFMAYLGNSAEAVRDDLHAMAAMPSPDSIIRPVMKTGTYGLMALCRLHDPCAARIVADQLSATEPDWLQLYSTLDLLGPWATQCRRALLNHIVTAPGGVYWVEVAKALGRVSTPADPDLDEVVAALLARLPTPVSDLLFGGRRPPRPQDICRILGDFGPAASAALPALHTLLEHPEPHVRLQAAHAIVRISADPQPALPVLRTTITVPGSPLPLIVLADVGPAGAEFTDTLRLRMTDHDPATATWAAIAFWHVTGDPAPVVPALVGRLADGSLGVSAGDWSAGAMVKPPAFPTSTPAEVAVARAAAVRCLGAIGPAAAPAVALLRRATTSPLRQVWDGSVHRVPEDDTWVEACTQALTRIEATLR
jgi:hypothetical protein